MNRQAENTRHAILPVKLKTPVDKRFETMPTTVVHYSEDECWRSKPIGLRSHRSRLQRDILRLQKRLQQELELHYVLESAVAHAAGAVSRFPHHLPIHVQKLLVDVAMLEATVSNLEEQMITLKLQLGYECRERKKAEYIHNWSSGRLNEDPKLVSAMPAASIDCKEIATATPLSTSLENVPNWCPSTLYGGHCHSLVPLDVPSPLQIPSVRVVDKSVSLCATVSKDNCTVAHPDHISHTSLRTSVNMPVDVPVDIVQSSWQSSSWSLSSDYQDCSIQGNSLLKMSRLEAEKVWPTSSLSSEKLLKQESKEVGSIEEDADIMLPEKHTSETGKGLLQQSTTLNLSLQDNTHGKLTSTHIRNLWRQPDRLSQEMVCCMVNIYRHLADPGGLRSCKIGGRMVPSGNIPSPTSPFGHITPSSSSSFSDSSMLSFTQSPSLDLCSKQEMATEMTFDPYRTRDKLPWADIGKYSTSIEVSWMSVGKEQLEYGAGALRMFRFLVERLSKVDPSSMSHDEKLAFWINIYNALMMHAYLAYGVPRSDLKLFSLMQKAAYTVGGYSFNAITIEHLLLKGKAPGYRPQIALLLALHKLKLPEEVSNFAIDHVEPLITFCLSCGAFSSPAVRVYTAKNIQAELQASLRDYVRASVGITAKGKLLLPKLLHTFARELLEESYLLDWICQFLPSSQRNIVQTFLQQRHHRFLSSKNFMVTPFDFRFRYLFIQDDDKQTSKPHFSSSTPSKLFRCQEPRPI
eukprot:c21275_g2_i2 orf=431-2671(-)